MDTSNTIQEDVPWYRQKAERPKKRITLNLFEEHIRDLLRKKFKDDGSAFTRYLFDCYKGIRIPTDSGFAAWSRNGEKFSDISK